MNSSTYRAWASYRPNVQVVGSGKLSEVGRGRLASYSIPAPQISAEGFLRQACGQARVFWANGGGQQAHAGFGIAAQLAAWGPGRFDDIQRQAAELFADAETFGEQNPLSMPRLFGGFAFREDFLPDNTWAVFHPAQFILPHFQLAHSAGESWLTINALLGPEESAEDRRGILREAVEARYSALVIAEQQVAGSVEYGAGLHLDYPLDYERWEEQVRYAVEMITRTALEKVVLARICEVSSATPIDIDGVLAYLNRSYRECTRFLFEPRPKHAFYGATPELLARVQGDQLETMALAGSAPRGETAVEDKAQQAALLASTKDQSEHRLVVEAMRRRLAPFVEEISLPESPEIYTLSYIHHLYTPIAARLSEASGVLPLVQALHPTPALGGTPRNLALGFISEVEQVPRGWYAGPIGWIDSELNGEFAVAIRSAVAQERRAWLYAGAGIIAGSIAAREWLETALKFEPMLRALGVSPSLAQGRATMEQAK